MTKQLTGRLIGGAFGLVFVQANAGALPQLFAAPLRFVAIAAFLGLFLNRRGFRAHTPAPVPGPSPRTGFGRRYWYVVAAEVLGLAVGLLLIGRVLHTPHAAVGWIAFVVGVHFFGLAVVWHRPSLHVLGAAIAACGLVALVLAVLDAPDAAVALAGGIAPGALLLTTAWRTPQAPDRPLVGV
ncbi:hypothetical protein [Streptomyces sp. NPDC089799]|uniref:hypothetical protein n=1 Tax=Streptomyces sp. NPDC089799 TaxID=3155066 RepID=UPI00343A322B